MSIIDVIIDVPSSTPLILFLVSREKPIGKCLVPLQPLLAQCELAVSSPILTEGRREAGGSIELALRLRKPIASDELIVTEARTITDMSTVHST